MDNPKYVTIIGSRDTPDDVLELTIQLGRWFARKGWILRSGGAPGMDTAGELGYQDVEGHRKEIFLPWNGYQGKYHDPETGYYCMMGDDTYPRACDIAAEIHPVWDRLTSPVQALHGRNPYQVLGLDLETPSDLVIYYAIPRKGQHVRGGTNTAVQAALQNQVSCLNLYRDATQRLLTCLLVDH